MSNLIKHGADPEVKDKDGLTPIDVLCNTFGLPRPQRPKLYSGFDVLKAAAPKKASEDYDDAYDSSADSSKSSSRDRQQECAGAAELYSWGDGSTFQLGHGTQDSKSSPRKIRTLSGVGISAVSASRSHVLALTNAGQVYSWGSGGGSGKLGLGSGTVMLPLPEPLSEAPFGGHRVIAVAAGATYSGFATAAGQVYVCGNGVLSPRRLVIQKEDPQPRIGQISMGDAHMVALSAAGRAYSWCGDFPTAKGAPSLHPVPGIESVKISMVCSGAAHAAAVSTGGKLYMWNYGRSGGSGGNSTGKAVHVPVTEDREAPEEGFEMAPCHRKMRPQKAVLVVHATAEGNITTAVSASGRIYVVDTADRDPIQIPFGKKSAKEAWLNATGLFAVTRTGALNFVPREPIDTYLRVTRNSDDDEDYWVVYGSHAEEAVPYPTTLLYQVGVFAAGASCALATVPVPAPVDFDGTVQSTFAESMLSVADSGLYADVTLCTADGASAVIPGHRIFVSRCSEFAELESGARVVTAAATEAELRDFVRLLCTDACLDPERTMKIAEAHGFSADPPVRVHLKQMRQSKCYSDVTLSCPGMKDGTFPAHRAVLAARSEYFSAMFGSGMLESRAPVVELREVAPNVLGHMLGYLYSDALELGSAKLSVKLDVLVAADEFLVPTMRDAAIRELSGDINADTVLDIANVAAEFRFHKLQELCTRFLVTNPIPLVCTSILFELDSFIRDEVLAVSYQKAMAAEQLSKKAYYKVEVRAPSSAKILASELEDEEKKEEEDDDDDDESSNTAAAEAKAKPAKPDPRFETPGGKRLNSKQRKQLQRRLEQEQREREEAERKKEAEEASFWDELTEPPQPPQQPPPQSNISGVEDEPTNAKIKIIRPQSKKSVKHVQFGTDDALEFIDPQEAEKKKKIAQPPKQQSAWKALPKVTATTTPLSVPPAPTKKQVPKPPQQKTQPSSSSLPPPPRPSSSSAPSQPKGEDEPYQAGGFQFNLADAIKGSTKAGKAGKKQQQKSPPQQKKQQQQQATWGSLIKKTSVKGSEPFKSLEEIQREELAKGRGGRSMPSSWGNVVSGNKEVKSLDEIMTSEMKRGKKK